MFLDIFDKGISRTLLFGERGLSISIFRKQP